MGKSMNIASILEEQKLDTSSFIGDKEKAKKTRAKKVIIDTELVREKNSNLRTNKTVNFPKNPTWIKQPNIITLLSYNYKAINIKVLVLVMDKIQSTVEESIKRRLNNEAGGVEQLSLFQDPKNQNVIQVNIQYSELGIRHEQYPIVREALKQLVTIPVEIDTVNPITKEKCWKLQGLMNAYFPKDNKRCKYFSIEMNKDVAKVFVDVDKGFTKYIKEVALSTESKYSLRIYMLISSWKDAGGFQMEMSKFRKWLDLGVKYPHYKDLYKRVIKPAYDELFEKADCWFELSESFKAGEKEPYLLSFKVLKAKLSAKDQEKLNTQIANIETMCFRYMNMGDEYFSQIRPLINLNNYEKILNKINYLVNYVKANHASISNVPQYCTTALLSEFDVLSH